MGSLLEVQRTEQRARQSVNDTNWFTRTRLIIRVNLAKDSGRTAAFSFGGLNGSRSAPSSNAKQYLASAMSVGSIRFFEPWRRGRIFCRTWMSRDRRQSDSPIAAKIAAN